MKSKIKNLLQIIISKLGYKIIKDDITLKLYPQIKKKGYFKILYPDFLERKSVIKNLDACYYHNFNTWDYQWTFSILINNGLSITPNKNLVKNIGFIENSTHTKTIDSYLSIPTEKMDFPLEHPLLSLKIKKLMNDMSNGFCGIN